MQRSHLQLLAPAGQRPGVSGFKLTGAALDGHGLCRVWLRRKDPWDRYLDPRVRSEVWDVRAYRKLDSAFAVMEEFTLASLDEMATTFAFPERPEGLDTLALNGDPIHDFVVSWARRVTGLDAAAPAPEPTPETTPETTPEQAPAAPAPAPAQAPAVQAAPAPTPEQAPEPTPEPTPAPEPTPEPVAPAAPAPARQSGLDPAHAEPVRTEKLSVLADAWDEIEEVAHRVSGEHPVVSED